MSIVKIIVRSSGARQQTHDTSYFIDAEVRDNERR